MEIVFSGYVNKQNRRIWGAEDPPSHYKQDTNASPKKYCMIALWTGGGVVGPNFFESYEG